MKSRFAGRVYECVNAAERRICGAHAVASPGRAEGLALSGQRATNLLQMPSSAPYSPAGPWVYHCISEDPAAGIAFVASSAQEAVDHCLAAHLFSEQSGIPVVCRLTPSIAEQVAQVTLPTPEQIQALLDTPPSQGEMLSPEAAMARTAMVLKRDSSATTDPEPEEAVAVRIGALPDTAWGRRLGLDFVAHIAGSNELHLDQDGGTLMVSRGGVPSEKSNGIDLLMMCGPVHELPNGWDKKVAPRGIVLLVTAGDLSHAGWNTLPSDVVERLREQRLALWHFDASRSDGDYADALVVAGGECIKRLQLSVPDSDSTNRPQRVSLDELVAQPSPPVAAGLSMTAGQGESGDSLASEIRDFHLRGQGGPFDVEPLPAQPLYPAALTAWAKPSDRSWPFPIVLPAATSLHEMLLNAIGDIEVPKAERELLRGEAWRICRQVLGRMEQCADTPPMRELVGESAKAVVEEFETGSEGRRVLQEVVAKWVEALPEEGRLVGPGQPALVDLYAERLRRRRQPALQELCHEARTIRVALEGRLEADRLHSGEGTAPSHLQASVGAVGSSLLDMNALSESLPPHRGSQSLSPDRQAQVKSIVEELKRFLSEAERSADFQQTDRFAVAVGLFDGLATTWLPVFRAIREGRLEIEGTYDPVLHAEPLARLDLSVLTEKELDSLPRVLVVVTEATLQQASLQEFSEVLQSGRPIHALIVRRLTDGAADADSFYPGLSYVSIAHREAYVFQGLLADPAELIAGLDGMMSAERPSVAFIAAPGSSGSAEWHWMRAETARQGRAAPQFSYDPARGVQGAHRFDLSHNPQPDQIWPLVTVEYTDETGTRQTLEERFTFAHAAALEPAWRPHIRILPREAWSDDQWPLADYLDALVTQPPDAVPYLWVVGDLGELKRAVLTRELALRCRDRMRFWTLLQEMAGINNEHVRVALQRAREEAEQNFEARCAELEQAHARALEEARDAESAATIDRLVTTLMQGDVPAPAAKPAPAPVAKPEPDSEPEPAPEPEEDGDISLDEAYIETPRCTTCDECTQLNPRMFVYNEDKQAILADLDAGTYADLVIAAEKCPVNCIFPGIPRHGDSTATPEMLERARAL